VLTAPRCRTKHAELEAVLEHKESEKQMIFSEMLQSKQRQEVLEQRLSKMVGVLVRACQTIGIGNQLGSGGLDHVPQQITNSTGDGRLDGNRRYKRPRLTAAGKNDMHSTFARSTDYSQADEWLDSLMHSMNRVSEAASAQGAFVGHSNQMRITNADTSPLTSSAHTSHHNMTEILDAPDTLEDAPGIFEIENPDALTMVAEVKELESVDGLKSPRATVTPSPRASIPNSPHFEYENRSAPPAMLEMKSEVGDVLKTLESEALDSQSLDLDSILTVGLPLQSPTAGTMSLLSPDPRHGAHGCGSLPISPSRSAALGSPVRPTTSFPGEGQLLLSCGQAAEMARAGEMAGNTVA
jgi:hypothetical protein